MDDVELRRLLEARLDDAGRELLNPVPVAPPVGYVRQPSLAEQIRNMVRSERLAMLAEEAGMETFEEADDFDVGDDFDPSSPYEEHFDPTPARELRRRYEAELAAQTASQGQAQPARGALDEPAAPKPSAKPQPPVAASPAPGNLSE